MKPALFRALPAAALSVPLLLAGGATAIAATAASPTPPATELFADEGHDPAPAPAASTEPVPADGASEQSGSDDDQMTEHEAEMAEHDAEMAEHEEDMTDHEEETVEHEEEMADHDDSGTAGRGTGDAVADEHGGSEDDHSGSGEHGSTAPEGDRPRVAVLSSFAGVNAAVLGGAAFLQRKDRNSARHRPRRAVDADATPPASGPGSPAPTAPASRS